MLLRQRKLTGQARTGLELASLDGVFEQQIDAMVLGAIHRCIFKNQVST